MDERRRWPRAPFVADIEYSAHSPPMRRQITDVSHGGVFVDTTTPLPEGLPVRLRFALPGQTEPMTVDAIVAWTQPHVGMGLRFTRLAPRDKTAIDQFVAARLGTGVGR